MGLESASWIDDLNILNPPGSDAFSQGDDHLRLLKTVLKNQFTSLGAKAVTVTADTLNGVISYGTAAGLAVDLYFIDSTKGIEWTLPSTAAVKLSAAERTIDLLDYEYLSSTAAGIVVNDGDAAQDSGFIACMVTKGGSSTKPAIIGFNDISDYGMICGMEYDINTDIMYVGNPNAGVLTGMSFRVGSDLITFADLLEIVTNLAGGTTGQSLQKVDGTDFNFQWVT